MQESNVGVAIGMVSIGQIVSALQQEISDWPDRFYNSFDYTTTGQNYTHPLTLGVLTKILWQLPEVKHVAIDFRLNEGGAKFQPDLVALSKLVPLQPLLFLDYESPNSSDIRILTKDIDSYEEWSNIYEKRVPYFIVTTLPNRTISDWELRYTGQSQYNAKYRGRKADICQNPFRFWYSEYKKVLGSRSLSEIYFINIDGKKVEHICL
jgi:hypothetical protein